MKKKNEEEENLWAKIKSENENRIAGIKAEKYDFILVVKREKPGWWYVESFIYGDSRCYPYCEVKLHQDVGCAQRFTSLEALDVQKWIPFETKIDWRLKK